VEKIRPFPVASPAEGLIFRAFDFGDAAVGVVIKAGAHVAEDNIWHLWLGIYLGGFYSRLVKSSGVAGHPLKPLCRGSKGR